MDSSRKSFKAYSVAQPIKKEIDDTLMKVELEKRKFLTYEREENFLRQNLDRKRKQLNDLKAKEADSRLLSNRAWQTGNIINNSDRTYLNTYDSIQQTKNTISLHRKQIIKYKEMISQLQIDLTSINNQNVAKNIENIQLQNNNEMIKQEIILLRENNIKNLGQFRKSHSHMNKSSADEENQRKKFAVKQKSFLGEEMKNSKALIFDGLSDQLRNSGIKFNDNDNEVMTESVPLAKERIKIEIHKNKEKLRISEDYKKFGQNLQFMFQIMKQYKGRDDLDFIASEFVTKEKQLQKIEEYIGQLESRIESAQMMLRAREKEDSILESEVNARVEKEDEKYAVMQVKVKQEIETLKRKQNQFYGWFEKISNVLHPLTGQSLTRSNAPNLIGAIEQSLNLNRPYEQKKQSSTKALPLPNIEPLQKQSYNQLLSYNKMRQFASEYVRSKKSQ